MTISWRCVRKSLSSRAWLLLALGTVALALVIALVILGDDSSAPTGVDADGYCLVLSADYEASLRSIIDPKAIGQTRDVVVPTVKRIYANFPASAPQRFNRQATVLVDGIDRAIEGQLDPGELEALVRAHDDLQAASSALCSSRPGVTAAG